MNEQIDFSQPQRQHILGIVIYLFKNFRALLSLVIAFLAIGSIDPWIMIILGIGLLLVLALILVLTYLQYHNFTFQLSGEQIIIKSGVISKNQQIIPFDRIQSVHISANFIQQVLGLVGLKIDTAGAKNEELEIPALKASVANELQRLLKQKSVAGANTQHTRLHDLEPEQPEQEAATEMLVKLSLGDLIKVGLTENHLRNGFLALAVLFSYFSQYYEYVQSEVETAVQEYSGRLMHMGYALLALGIAVFLVASITLSMVRSMLRYYQFEAQLQQGFVFIKSGLLKRNQYRIPVSKIQFLRWNTNPLRRWMGMATVDVFQAQSADAAGRSKISIPACYQMQSEKLRQHVFDNLKLTPDFIVKPLRQAYVGLAASVLALPLALATFMAIKFQVGWIWPVLAYLLALGVVWKRAGKIELRVSADTVVLNKGWLLSGRTLLPLFKSQAVQYSQPAFLRKRNLAHLTFYTASGSITIRYLNSAAVWQLYNHALAQTIISKRSWM